MKSAAGAATVRPGDLAVWATATLFVTIVSCCSLIGVSIMPLISGPSYKIFITLFTGLAVGSLLGSAIFSLIPQAFNLHTIHNDGHAYLWKALVIFFGIYLFYCSERLMRIYFERRTQRRLKKHNNKTGPPNNSAQSQQQAAVDDEKQQQQQQQDGGSKLRDIEEGAGKAPAPQGGSTADPLLMRRVKSEDNRAVSGAKRDAADTTGPNQDNGDNLAMRPVKPASDKAIEPANNKQEPNDAPGLHGHQHVGHHHTHLNPHDIITSAANNPNNNSAMKQAIAPVAWMIIFGDGLHNFIDGLSIGAAFKESIYFGISTSVAVICEEFPHELGDFAVLISSGMRVKQALCCNFFSACTCYVGMVFGILLGDTTQSASYIFALAGGMFLYIALVDMMGELSATLDEPNQSTKETLKLLIMQNIGLLTGIIVIFSLAWIDV